MRQPHKFNFQKNKAQSNTTKSATKSQFTFLSMPKVDLSKCRVKFCLYVPRSKESLDDHVNHQHRNIRNELVCPHCPSYTTKQMSNLNSHMSACHDPERVRLLCPIEGCGSSQASQRHLDDHVAKKHRGEGYMLCPVDDCTFRTQYQNVLELHIQSVHCEERSFKCSFEGCKNRETISLT